MEPGPLYQHVKVCVNTAKPFPGTLRAESYVHFLLLVCFYSGQCEDLGTKYIDGGMLNISDTTHKVNTTITVTCYDGYYRGGGTITCGENGNWSSPTLPPCYPGGDERLFVLKIMPPYSTRAYSSHSFPLPLPFSTMLCKCRQYSGEGAIFCGS